jgi:2-phospho-L-lactate transferase/gluconeogenesis factor (CofD/UPF0052 family)
VAISRCDDGASTGEIRRFLGDSLGPSDFRKNASRLAAELRSCPPALVALLDLRLPVDCAAHQAVALFRALGGGPAAAGSDLEAVVRLAADLDAETRTAVEARLQRFERERIASGRDFSFSDCSLGNLVLAGSFLLVGRDFNAAVADYCRLLGLPDGMVENVTTGTNAYLVALDRDGRLLRSEADIVNATLRSHIDEIFLIDRPVSDSDAGPLTLGSREDRHRFLLARAAKLTLNPRLGDRLAEADLIIYSPGTQHSSLFPSYLTPGLGATIARNLTAIKLLITNLHEDAETPDSSAVDIVEKAVYYMREKDAQRIPTPCLITHYLINDPGRSARGAPYVSPGRLESLEDPRLIRIGHYEDGVTGYHDAVRVLTPFIESRLLAARTPTVTVFLLGTRSLDKISQTICEMLRGGIQRIPARVTVLYGSHDSFDAAFTESLPFELHNVGPTAGSQPESFLAFLRDKPVDYILLFDSSGMYRGEDIVPMVSALAPGRLDSVWGSRRLSVRDIHESYLLRYRDKVLLGAVSYLGSHILSLAYLLLYGRYISDTLSGVRAVRPAYLEQPGLDLDHRCLNQELLSLLLRDRAEVFEIPVHFLPISPEKVQRTTVTEGLQGLLTILWRRLRPRRPIRRGRP